MKKQKTKHMTYMVARVVAQRVKLPLSVLASRRASSNLAALLWIQLTADAPGKSVGDGPNISIPATHDEDPGTVCGF